MQELDLIKGCQQNSYKAQMQVYELYKDMLYNTSWRILRNDYDAQDAVHDTFIKGFKNISQIKEGNKLGGWLKRIVINRSLDIVKKKSKVLRIDDVENIKEEEEEVELVDIEVNKSITVSNINKCLDQIKEKYRIILTLYLIENYTHKDIAEMLSLNENTVRNQYVRGKKQLQEVIKLKYGLWT